MVEKQKLEIDIAIEKKSNGEKLNKLTSTEKSNTWF